ncbi:WD40-repeat-containing domain-containing protein [Strongyloides ratti]|uniref:WD40-repeat-containing domain-containing protein n=1 Tax=Strongyloides ratti TaxID=34506 RepID=A0A090LQ53_STRRB|nr:WD40-repeat-containing domain-containing protein [Strongyloides ratti]CEF69671.1 WD40-repeat-containing domain-containing protein [Strongyloides ratti]
MMATIGVRNIIEKNCDNKGSTKEAVRLLSNSLFEINQLEPLKWYDDEERILSEKIVWNNFSRNLVVAFENKVSFFKIGDKLNTVFSNRLPVDSFKAISNLPSSHIIVGVSSDNKVIFYDGINEKFAELSLMIPVFTDPSIYCHRWKDQTYIIVCGKGTKKTVWITLEGHISYYEKANNLFEAIDKKSTSGILDYSLSDSVVVFSPENNLLYTFTKTPGGFNRYYRLTNKGMFVYKEVYSPNGYISVTMTPSFAFALSTDGCLNILELRMFVICKQIFLFSENTTRYETIHSMQVTANSKTCSLDGLYMLVSVSTGTKHQLQVRLALTNEILCSTECYENSTFLRWDSVLNMIAFVEMSGKELILKTITEAAPDLKVDKLVSLKKFKEALDLAKKFGVSFDSIYKAQASDLLEKLRSGESDRNSEDVDNLYCIIKKIENHDTLCDLCLEGIISLNVFDVVKKLLNIALNIKTKNRYIVEQFNIILTQFTTAKIIFSPKEFTEKWLSIVTQHTSMYSLMADAIQDGDYKRSDIIWNRHILKSDFNKNITNECTTRMIQIFSHHALINDIRSDLMQFMEKDFMPFALMKLGSEVGCMYAEALIQVIVDLEDEENENYPLIAYNISLSLERISRLLKESILTPGEKCLFVDIKTNMNYDSFSPSNTLGKLNKLKENLFKLVNLKQRYNLTFKYEKFINLSKEDIGLHIVEKMLIQENECEYIYKEVFKPYCDEFLLDFKSLICNFVQKWSAQQITFTDDIQVGLQKNKIGSICKLIKKIDDPILEIKALQHLTVAVPFNWPKELGQSVYAILTDTSVAKDVKSELASRCKLSEICSIIKTYTSVPYEIEDIIKNKNEFNYLIQSISFSHSSSNIKALANDVLKLYQLRHSYCNLPGSFTINYDYVYVQLWIPYLNQWRFSGYVKETPMKWLFSLPNTEVQKAIAKYSIKYILDIYKRNRQPLNSSEEKSLYLKSLSVVKSFILNYQLCSIRKYQLIFEKITSTESFYQRYKLLKCPTFFLETQKKTSSIIVEIIKNFGIENWSNILKIAKLFKIDNVLAYKYLFDACIESGKLDQISVILFNLSLDKSLLKPDMLSVIKTTIDKVFLKLYESFNEKSFNLIKFVDMTMLTLKVFSIQVDETNLQNILAFNEYHKFLNVIKNMVDSKSFSVSQDNTIEIIDELKDTRKHLTNLEIHPLAHLQKPCNLKYHITLNSRSKPFTRIHLQLPMNLEYNIETLLSLSGSLLVVVENKNDEKDEKDEIEIKNLIEKWKNLFNQLLMDGQYFDVFDLLEIFNTLPISKNEDIYISEIVKHAAVGLVGKILMLPDCDLELALGVINSVSEKYVPNILQEIRNCLNICTNPRVHINLCELVAMVYHKISQAKMVEMLTERYDECIWKRKFSKFKFNYSSKMTLNEVISSLVRSDVPHNIAFEFCLYNNIDINMFSLKYALESSLYSSELIDINANLEHIEQVKKTSNLLSTVSVTEEHISYIQETIMKMSPYDHEGLLLLIDKALQITKNESISDNVKCQLYDWKIVIDFVISYGKRSGEILPIECNWLSSYKSSFGNETSSITNSFDSIESNYSLKEISMIEFEILEEKREAARKRMPQCAIQRLPFHLLCCTSEDEMKQFVCPLIFNEINIHNSYKWVNITTNTKSVLHVGQCECIFTAINKRIQYAEDNNIFVGDVDRNWIASAINAVDASKVSTIIKYSSRYTTNLKNLGIKIAYLSIFKEITQATAESLEGDKKEELLKYKKELSKRIIKYTVEKILFDNGLLDQETKAHLKSENINEMICFIYSNLIDWNNHQERTLKMEACKKIAKITNINLSSIHSMIINALLVQETVTEVGDPYATIDISAEIVPINQGTNNRLECDILDDDINVSKIVNILRTEDYSSLIKKMFSILNKDPKVLPGGICTFIKVILCICRMYPRNGEKEDCFKADKSQILIVLNRAYYYHMLSTINVNCKMIDLMNENKIIEIFKQLQNSPVHSSEKDFVVVNIIRDYLKKSPEYFMYMKTYIPRMIMGRQFFMAKSILDDSNCLITSDHMENNILNYVLKTIEGIFKQDPNNNDTMEDMFRLIIKHSVSFGYTRPPRETGLFYGNQEMSKIIHCILNPAGN